MADHEKFRAALNDASKDYGHRFNDLVRYLKASGWPLRIKGSHHIFTRSGVPVLLNAQPEGNKAKGYQVAQIRKVLNQYNL